MVSPEPRFARIAAMIGDPTRARMLAALMGGQYLAAGELAAAAGVSAQTASTHITKLLDSELVSLRVQPELFKKIFFSGLLALGSYLVLRSAL